VCRLALALRWPTRRTSCFSAQRAYGKSPSIAGWAADFRVDARVLRRGLIDNGYRKLPILSEHAVAIDALPPIHKDPFDRMLIAQATVEGITLLTDDATVAQYPGPVQLV
jgi:hypothetical protein